MEDYLKKKQTTPSIAELENTILEGLNDSITDEQAHSKDDQSEKKIEHLINEAVDQLTTSEDLFSNNKASAREEKESSSNSQSKTKDKSHSAQDAVYLYSDNHSIDFKKEIPESISKDSFVLTLSNHVTIAEKRIKELEADNNHLRFDNNKLLLAGETLQSSYDQLFDEHHTMKENYDEDRNSLFDQKKALEQAMAVQSAEIRNLRMKINTLEKHLNRDVQKIRIRERDLENRLQFKQKELDTIVREKDEDLISMKREVDSLRDQLHDAQDRVEKWMHQQSIEKDRSHRVSRALQMSLHLLQGEEGSLESSRPVKEEKLESPESEAQEEGDHFVEGSQEESSIGLGSEEDLSLDEDQGESLNDEEDKKAV